MASQEELDELAKQNGDELVAGKPKLNVLKSAPEGGVKPPKQSASYLLRITLIGY